MPVPTIVSTRLCGAKLLEPKPLRLPRIRQSTSADQPARHVHDRAAREIDGLDRRLGVPHAVHEAVDAPNHVGEREVDDEHPAAP